MFKRIVHTLLLLGVWGVLIAYMFVASSHSQKVISTITIDSLDIVVADHASLNFVDDKAIKQWLSESDLTYCNAPLKEVNTALVQQHLREHLLLKDANCYTTMDGVLHISVSQHRPVARIMASNGYDFYLSEDGSILPLLPEHPMYVPVITIDDKQFKLPADYYGDAEHIEARLAAELEPKMARVDSLLAIQLDKKAKLLAENPNSSTNKVDQEIKSLVKEQKILKKSAEKYLYLHKLLNFVMFVEGDSFWQAQILQINLSASEPYSEPMVEIVPRAGKHIVCLGTLDQAQEGLEKLRLFYHEALAWEGWDGYSYIDLRYKDQIVCRK